MISCLALLLFIPFVSALPLENRATQIACGKFESIQSGSYSILTNLWGEASAASGSQCSTLTSIHGNTISWSTKWTWMGDNDIKSFANVQLNEGINQQLSAINSMPSTWQWSQKLGSTERFVSDVAYDLFTSHSPGGPNAHEAMIWLFSLHAQPISHTYDASGKAFPVATNIDIAGRSWDLYSGSNGANPVYSFLPSNGHVSAFSGDIHDFFKYLIQRGNISSSEYLKTAQAGTEATCGSATFVTSAYSLAIH